MRAVVKSVELISDKVIYTNNIVKYKDILNYIKSTIPVDGREIVEWMQEAYAISIVMDSFAIKYAYNGGEFIHRTGDGYIPGVHLHVNNNEYTFIRQPGYVVARRGYALTNTGAHVPVRGWSWIDTLRVIASVPKTYFIQFIGFIGAYTRYASIPIRQSIQFPRVADITLPLVLRDHYIIPIPFATYIFTISVEDDTESIIHFYDRSRKIYAETKVNLQKGTNRVAINVFMPMSGYIEIIIKKPIEACLNSAYRLPL